MSRSSYTIVFGGPDFQPEEFLRNSRLEPSIVRRGDALRHGRIAEGSWVEFADIHNGTFPLDVAAEALFFLRAHRDEFVRLSGFPGMVTRSLNFFGDAASCSTDFEPADVALLCELSVEVSIEIASE